MSDHEESYCESLRREIEEQYLDHPTGCGGSFGEILCHEIHTNGLAFKWLAQKWKISLPTLGELIWDHCKRLETQPVVNHKYVPMHQTCKVCGQRDKFNFDVPDELWEKIVPPEFQHLVVCLACFDDFAHEKGVEYAEHIHPFYFAGDQETFEFKAITSGNRRAHP